MTRPRLVVLVALLAAVATAGRSRLPEARALIATAWEAGCANGGFVLDKTANFFGVAGGIAQAVRWWRGGKGGRSA